MEKEKYEMLYGCIMRGHRLQDEEVIEGGSRFFTYQEGISDGVEGRGI